MRSLLITFLLPVCCRADTSPISPKLKQRGEEAKQFAKARGYNTEMVFLLDLSVSSGRNRFFVYDTRKDSIIDQGLVTHGHCHTMSVAVKFSNTPGCACSASGRYRVGKSYMGRFGLAYRLTGLDSTNNMAEKRAIVMHSHSCVPDKEVYPQEICRSEGCTTVSPGFLRRLQRLIQASKQPVLMWVYG